MSWVNDLASAAGIPAGAATLAVAMYAACAAAEKAARPEALKDIGRILKGTTWERSVRLSAIIEQVFNWTFGERHLSLYAPETKSLSEVAGLSGCAGVKFRRWEALCVERRGLEDEAGGAVWAGPLRGSDRGYQPARGGAALRDRPS